jgi:TPR repeat protein
MKIALLGTILFLSIGTSLHAYNYGTFEGNTKGCDEGDAKACNDLAGMYLSGDSKYHVKEDKIKAKEFYDKSIKLYQRYCNEGNGKACFDLGDKYNGMRWGIDQDYKTMMQHYTKACEYGNSFACNELGVAYKRGKGVIKNEDMSKMYYDKALVLYEQECENNIAESCDRLSMIYRAEMYGTNDSARGLALHKKTFNLYKELCNRNDAEGCWQVAKSYHIGANAAIKVDWIKAKAYYKKSCDLGESSACWKEKEIDPKEQIKYEKKMELAAIDLQYRLKKKEEEDKWQARAERQRKEYFDSNLTNAKKEELLKKMESENIVWRKESNKRLEKARIIFEQKQKEIEALLK